ncbi:efflux RND transporter periplasmic adaptor subunit [Lampropedia aestuarii]|uniref:efflux RND transporter periplasmic adaptor subunit n=1 Tax=Lampropedia aestuarii TaxID=2562762 RepID=UPI0024692EC1|nr:efflux RND transporter periplasmic adaptor subunit [Lampropedia aestuarii]MDH5858960.1 efflux RND transporter periplasmic adaptor subunit [Lampropedia aestuarii]
MQIQSHPRTSSRLAGTSFIQRVRVPAMLSCIGLAVLLTGCLSDKEDAGAAPAGAAQQMPTPEVGVVIATPQTIALVTQLPGRVEASRVAEVRARVQGIVTERVFKEGSQVKAGQLLYKIDSEPYQALLQSAKASLASAEANLGQAKTLADRYRPLVAVNAVSQQEFDNADAAFKAAQANVAVARAAVRTAEINLGYASVTAPIAGRIGQALVTEGALVGDGTPTPLALIQQIDTVYVNFTQSSADALALQRLMQQGQLLKIEGENAAKVQIVLEDGSDYGVAGKLLFSEISVDPSTGQVTLRAEIPNPDRLLLPGMYVRVNIEQAQVNNAIAIPQQAVTRTQQGDTVTVVDAEGNRQVKPVKVRAASNNTWLVESGLEAGEQVMVDGFQRLQMMPPNVKVKPVPWKSLISAPDAEQPAANTTVEPIQGAAAPAAKQ